MTDEDQKKIQAIADGLNVAIRDAWPGLCDQLVYPVDTLPS